MSSLTDGSQFCLEEAFRLSGSKYNILSEEQRIKKLKYDFIIANVWFEERHISTKTELNHLKSLIAIAESDNYDYLIKKIAKKISDTKEKIEGLQQEILDSERFIERLCDDINFLNEKSQINAQI